MNTRHRIVRTVVVAVTALTGTSLPLLPGVAIGATAAPPVAATKADAKAAFEALPLRFEANEGQFDPAVRFAARAGSYTLFLTGDEAVLSMARPEPDAGLDPENEPFPASPGQDVVRMRLAGATPQASLSPTDRLPGVTNYFVGNDPAGWHTEVPSYAGVRYEGVYPGVDLVFRQGDDAVEYDFEVAPGASSGAIAMVFEGAEPTVDEAGDLVLALPGGGKLRQSKPKLFQGRGAGKHPVDGSFTVGLDGSVGFQVGAYDRSQPLVIDPVLTYSSYLAGTTGASVATDVATGTSGAAYVTGHTLAADFPTKSAAFPTRPGLSDRFVAKFNTSVSGASSLAYATYLGGSYLEDGAGSIAVDGSGNAYVTGATTSTNFPTTAGAYDGGCGTSVAAICNGTDMTYTDGETTAGSTNYSSVQAGWGNQDIGLAVSGTNVPAGTTIIASGPGGTSTMILSAPATGTGTGLTFTIAERYRAPDAFLTKLNATGTALLYSTYLGGESDDVGEALALDAAGIAYVAGRTISSAMPTAVPLDGALAGASGLAADGAA